MNRDGQLDSTLADDADPADAPGAVFDGSEPRYEVRELLGRGGMGEVLRARDRRVDRDVAFKRLPAGADEYATARFLREARIQGRLDHPAIVPVHDVGVDSDGRPFFTMKRLAGTTLAEHLARDASPQRLLRAFVDVCRAVELAHARGIIHRDLKPANIMLGDYGEVYVLDWGLARELGRATSERGDYVEVPPSTHTGTGALLGTPGYMPPEQVQDAARVGRPADIYALGAILFEILARTPLHPRGAAALESTIGTVDPSPARRAPDRSIAPELDALCAAMLATDPASRPIARDVADRVQAYLDGDRDLERRRLLARDELAAAHRAFAADHHADAMRHAGRALALDPQLAGAAELVGRLMLEPPPTPPPALVRELETVEQQRLQGHAAAASRTYLPTLLFMPLALWNGVRYWPVLLAFFVMATILSLSAFRLSRTGARSTREIAIYVIGTGALVSLIGRICGPLTLAPVLACTIFMSTLAYPPITRRPWIAAIAAMLGWLLPIFAELAGLLQPNWTVIDGAVIQTSNVLEFYAPAATALLFGGTFAMLVVAGMQALAVARQQLDAQRRLTTQAWQLRQLIAPS